MNMLLARRSQWRFWIKILVTTQFHDKLQLLSVSEPRGHMWGFCLSVVDVAVLGHNGLPFGRTLYSLEN